MFRFVHAVSLYVYKPALNVPMNLVLSAPIQRLRMSLLARGELLLLKMVHKPFENRASPKSVPIHAVPSVSNAMHRTDGKGSGELVSVYCVQLCAGLDPHRKTANMNGTTARIMGCVDEAKIQSRPVIPDGPVCVLWLRILFYDKAF